MDATVITDLKQLIASTAAGQIAQPERKLDEKIDRLEQRHIK